MLVTRQGHRAHLIVYFWLLANSLRIFTRITFHNNNNRVIILEHFSLFVPKHDYTIFGSNFPRRSTFLAVWMTVFVNVFNIFMIVSKRFKTVFREKHSFKRFKTLNGRNVHALTWLTVRNVRKIERINMFLVFRQNTKLFR